MGMGSLDRFFFYGRAWRGMAGVDDGHESDKTTKEDGDEDDVMTLGYLGFFGLE